jgi:hypothetical protein
LSSGLDPTGEAKAHETKLRKKRRGIAIAVARRRLSMEPDLTVPS